jgi:hypothetical protein
MVVWGQGGAFGHLWWRWVTFAVIWGLQLACFPPDGLDGALPVSDPCPGAWVHVDSSSYSWPHQKLMHCVPFIEGRPGGSPRRKAHLIEEGAVAGILGI